jgi:hypothetical protein
MCASLAGIAKTADPPSRLDKEVDMLATVKLIDTLMAGNGDKERKVAWDRAKTRVSAKLEAARKANDKEAAAIFDDCAFALEGWTWAAKGLKENPPRAFDGGRKPPPKDEKKP